MLRARPRHPLKSLSGSLVVALVGVDAEGRTKIRGSDSLLPDLYGLASCRTDFALISIFKIGPVKKADSTVRKPFIVDILLIPIAELQKAQRPRKDWKVQQVDAEPQKRQQ